MHGQAPGTGCILPRVECDSDVFAAELGDPIENFIGLAHRQRAHHHTRHANIEQALHIIAVADATAGLDPQSGTTGQLAQQGVQAITPFARGIQINRSTTLDDTVVATSGGADALSSLLGQEHTAIRQQGGAAGGLLGSMLDQDGDGQLGLGDLLKAGEGFLGGGGR